MSLRLLRSWTQPPAPTFDMGQGHTLSAEDLLDGHFRRMTTRPATQTVRVQVDDQLQVSITVLAPELSPLTYLAEELVDVVRDVRPEPRFRADLHRALEQTHRQQTAQRTLGTRTPDASHSTVMASWWKSLPVLLTLLALVWVWLARRRASRR